MAGREESVKILSGVLKKLCFYLSLNFRQLAKNSEAEGRKGA